MTDIFDNTNAMDILINFYLDDYLAFSLGKSIETNEILIKDNRINFVYTDIVPEYQSLEIIFRGFGCEIVQNTLRLYDSINTQEMITLPLNRLFDKMDMMYRHNVDISIIPRISQISRIPPLL